LVAQVSSPSRGTKDTQKIFLIYSGNIVNTNQKTCQEKKKRGNNEKKKGVEWKQPLWYIIYPQVREMNPLPGLKPRVSGLWPFIPRFESLGFSGLFDKGLLGKQKGEWYSFMRKSTRTRSYKFETFTNKWWRLASYMT
jgi:hypothetical protein